MVRNAGTHAAGVVIADKPLMEYLPLHRPTSNSEETPIKTVTQFEMGILDSLGMLKVDFLGLITLTRHGTRLRPDREAPRRRIRPEQHPHWMTRNPLSCMGSGQTAGVFQVEGGGMTRWLVQMKPKTSG